MFVRMKDDDHPGRSFFSGLFKKASQDGLIHIPEVGPCAPGEDGSADDRFPGRITATRTSKGWMSLCCLKNRKILLVNYCPVFRSG